MSIGTGQMITLTGDTTGASDKFVGSAQLGTCPMAYGTGPDLAYAVSPVASGMLSVTLTANYNNPYVHVRTKCMGNMIKDEIACESALNSGTLTTATFPVTSGTIYWVVPDSWMNQAGTFTLKLSLN